MDKLLFRRIVIAAITILAIIYVAYLLISANFTMYPTENAVETTVTDKIYANAFIIRDETFVKNNSSGVLSFSVEDGDAVKAGGEIAKIYSSEADAVARTQAAALQKKLDLLKSLQNTKVNTGISIETIDSNINNSIISFQTYLNQGKLNNSIDTADSLLYSINQRQVFTGKVKSFNNEIAQLESQINSYNSSSAESIGSLKAERPGYFSTHCDGYETAYSYNDIDKLTLDSFSKIKRSSVPSDVTGKIISSLNWYVACKVNSSEARNLDLWDNTVTLRFSDASTELVKASIYKIVRTGKDSDALIILKCNYMNTELSEIRQEPVEIGLGTYFGLRVNKKAIHDDYVKKTVTDSSGNEHTEEKKVQGVYVLYGSEVQFKEIAIVYSGNDYVICDPKPEDGVLFSNSTISLYDQILLEGDNLYDGKVIGGH